MKENIEQRLCELKTEFESGQKILAELETKQVNVKQTVIRISGAILVLEEILEEYSNEEKTEIQLPDSSKEPRIQKIALG